MKRKIINLIIMMLAIPGYSIGQNSGVVNINGEIFESTCTLVPNDAYQTVVLGVASIGHLSKNKNANSYPFSIKLINCALINNGRKNSKVFDITFVGEGNRTFDGILGKNGNFGVTVIYDNKNKVIPDMTLSDTPLVNGEVMLTYQLNIVGNVNLWGAGNYPASMGIILSYQ